MFTNFNLSYTLFCTSAVAGGMANAQTISSVTAISHRRIFSDMEQTERDGGMQIQIKWRIAYCHVHRVVKTFDQKSQIIENVLNRILMEDYRFYVRVKINGARTNWCSRIDYDGTRLHLATEANGRCKSAADLMPICATGPFVSAKRGARR